MLSSGLYMPDSTILTVDPHHVMPGVCSCECRLFQSWWSFCNSFAIKRKLPEYHFIWYGSYQPYHQTLLLAFVRLDVRHRAYPVVMQAVARTCCFTFGVIMSMPFMECYFVSMSFFDVTLLVLIHGLNT